MTSAISSPYLVPRDLREVQRQQVAGGELGQETLGGATPISGPAWV